MGSFSWCTSDTKKSIPCCIPFGDLPGTVYLLNPFGEPYKETDYNGYGKFGGRDVYDLVAEWNREYLSPANIQMPDRSNYEAGATGDAYFAVAMAKYFDTCAAIQAYRGGASDKFMQEHYGPKISPWNNGADWKRIIGITIACYDEDHVKLKYPIKIVEHPVPYEQAGISPGCPFQGCIYPDSMRQIQKEVNKAFDRLADVQEKYKASRSLDNKIQTAAGKSGESRPKGKQTNDRDR